MIFSVVALDPKNTDNTDEMIVKMKSEQTMSVLMITCGSLLSYMLLAILIWRCLKKHFVTPIREINRAI